MNAKELVLKNGDGHLAGDYTPTEVYNLMIEFAKLKCQEQLEAIKENVCLTDYSYESAQEGSTLEIDMDSINDAYNLEEIK